PGVDHGRRPHRRAGDARRAEGGVRRRLDGRGVRPPRALGRRREGGGVSAMRGFVVKELHHILRDRQTLLILLLLPLAQVLLFGFALRTDIEGVRLVVVDPRPDASTLELRGRFAATGLFRIVGVEATAAGLAPRFQAGGADQAVVFEPGFGEKLAHEGRAQVMVITDATDPNTGSAMQAYASAVIKRYEQETASR